MNTNEQIQSKLTNEYGFAGTLQRNLNLTDKARAEVFDKSVRFVADHLNISLESARRFLDSTSGRHLANEFGEDAQLEALEDVLLESLFVRYGDDFRVRKSVRKVLPHFVNTTDEDFYA